jgi:hypothetical protein
LLGYGGFAPLHHERGFASADAPLAVLGHNRRRQGTDMNNARKPNMLKAMSMMLTAAVLAVALGACSSTEVVAPTMNVSVGKQLMDLKKARDSGALSQKEWEQQKQNLINAVK